MPIQDEDGYWYALSDEGKRAVDMIVNAYASGMSIEEVSEETGIPVEHMKILMLVDSAEPND